MDLFRRVSARLGLPMIRSGTASVLGTGLNYRYPAFAALRLSTEGAHAAGRRSVHVNEKTPFCFGVRPFPSGPRSNSLIAATASLPQTRCHCLAATVWLPLSRCHRLAATVSLPPSRCHRLAATVSQPPKDLQKDSIYVSNTPCPQNSIDNIDNIDNIDISGSLRHIWPQSGPLAA